MKEGSSAFRVGKKVGGDPVKGLLGKGLRGFEVRENVA